MGAATIWFLRFTTALFIIGGGFVGQDFVERNPSLKLAAVAGYGVILMALLTGLRARKNSPQRGIEK